MFQVTIEDQLLAGLPREEGEGEVEKVVKRQVGFETGTFGPPTVSISCTRQGQKNQVRVGRIRMMADNSMYNKCYISLGPSLVARPLHCTDSVDTCVGWSSDVGRASKAATMCRGDAWVSTSIGSVIPASGAMRATQRVLAWVNVSSPPSER